MTISKSNADWAAETKTAETANCLEDCSGKGECVEPALARGVGVG